MVSSDFQVVPQNWKEESKFALMEHGGLYVIAFGLQMMPVLSVGSLDTQNMVY